MYTYIYYILHYYMYIPPEVFFLNSFVSTYNFETKVCTDGTVVASDVVVSKARAGDCATRLEVENQRC